MSIQNNIDFERIKAAIGYIHDNFKMQPELEKVAAFVHLSPFHFQRLFTDWAGVSPKKFLQYTSIQYAKNILKDNFNKYTKYDLDIRTNWSGSITYPVN